MTMKKKYTIYMLLLLCMMSVFSMSAKAEWKIEGSSVYYLKDGVKQTGWFKLGSYTYYLGEDGVRRTGWQTIDGARYYFKKKNGRMVTGTRKIAGKSYTFAADGRLVAQLSEVKTSFTGWKTEDGKVYYYVKDKLASNMWVKEKGKKTYYVQADGTRASGFVTIGKKRYYFDPDTGKVVKGLFKLSSTDFYFANKSTGVIYEGQFFKVSSRQYYADAKGKLAQGFVKVGRYTYYAKPNTARLVVKKKIKINGYTYYFNKKGRMQTAKWVKISGKYYYFDASGHMIVNGTADGYYVGADGARGAKVDTFTGWKTIDSSKYYFENGTMVTGWKTISGSRYYFAEDGKMAVGIQTINGKKYYFYPTGIMASNLTLAVGSKQYTINKNGVVSSEITINVSGTSKGAKIAQYALRFVGNKYVYGGTSLTGGADCSGFVYSVFANFGIKMMRVANDQMYGPSSYYISQGYKQAVTVSSSDILPGDLVFYGTSSYASHVGIYIGNGQIVHASNSQPYPAGGIKISAWNYSTPVRIVRYWS